MILNCHFGCLQVYLWDKFPEVDLWSQRTYTFVILIQTCTAKLYSSGAELIPTCISNVDDTCFPTVGFVSIDRLMKRGSQCFNMHFPYCE